MGEVPARDEGFSTGNVAAGGILQLSKLLTSPRAQPELTRQPKNCPGDGKGFWDEIK